MSLDRDEGSPLSHLRKRKGWCPFQFYLDLRIPPHPQGTWGDGRVAGIVPCLDLGGGYTGVCLYQITKLNT